MMLNVDFMLRLLVAGILGAIIGLDREYRAKEAGYRTHFLVSLGSALIMIVSQYGFQEIIKENSVTLDPSRVAAQVVSGIGFIGAGTIILQKQTVRVFFHKVPCVGFQLRFRTAYRPDTCFKYSSAQETIIITSLTNGDFSAVISCAKIYF